MSWQTADFLSADTIGLSSAAATGFSSANSTGFSSADTAGLPSEHTTGSSVPRTWVPQDSKIPGFQDSRPFGAQGWRSGDFEREIQFVYRKNQYI